MAVGFESGRPCSVCGGATRRPHPTGAGKNAKRQRPKWWVCERGHKLYRKVGQLG